MRQNPAAKKSLNTQTAPYTRTHHPRLARVHVAARAYSPQDTLALGGRRRRGSSLAGPWSRAVLDSAQLPRDTASSVQQRVLARSGSGSGLWRHSLHNSPNCIAARVRSPPLLLFFFFFALSPLVLLARATSLASIAGSLLDSLSPERRGCCRNAPPRVYLYTCTCYVMREARCARAPMRLRPLRGRISLRRVRGMRFRGVSGCRVRSCCRWGWFFVSERRSWLDVWGLRFVTIGGLGGTWPKERDAVMHVGCEGRVDGGCRRVVVTTKT